MSARPPDVSVVVATRDREQRLAGLLRALGEQRLDPERFEVIVVDDRSADGTAELLERTARTAPFQLASVSLERGSGPAAARNAGWTRARAPLVAFTDDDCEPHPDWLREAVDAAGRRRDSVVVGPTHPLPSELHLLGPFSRTRESADLSPWFPTCNIVYPREILARLHGFDESFPEALGEDTDLGWRAVATGAKVRFAPRALVYHAVDDVGPLRHLRTALLGSDAVLAFRRHPELRARGLRFGIVRTPAHLLLLLALSSVIAARRRRLASLGALPYLRYLASRCREANSSLAYAPYFLLYDSLHLLATVRGDLRHRVLVI
jgi:GT2 family glycosyltransferase